MADNGYVSERIREFYENQDYIDYLLEKFNKYKYICIWGVGNIGRPTAREMIKRGLKVDFFCDNDSSKYGNIYDGVMCKSLDELLCIKDETLVIVCGRASEIIIKQLIDLGMVNVTRLHVNKFKIKEYMSMHEEEELVDCWEEALEYCCDEKSKDILEAILNEWVKNESNSLEKISTDDQYFCDDVFELNCNETVIDGGAYNGDTLQRYLDVVGDFNKMLLFELSSKNYKDMTSYLDSLEKRIRDKIVAYNYGLSDKDDTIVYAESDEGSMLNASGSLLSMGRICRIDTICNQDVVSFIKMDIEGSELAALRGAEDCIRNNSPKLAICVYHKPQDIWEIPRYIRKINPNYSIYYRHHTCLMNETVCYAVLER